ncbi:hypothetical protein JCM18899A_53580 [Nocardioides sp. AN3]
MVLLEGSDRLGGRIFARPFTGLPDISVDDFFAPLDLPAATRDLLNAMVVVYGGWNPGAVSIFSLLSQIAALGNDPYALHGALTERFVGGLHILLEAMVSGSGVEVLFRHRAVAVERSATGLTVRAANGVSVAARECIVAVPTNVIRHIDFIPSVSPEKVKMLAENHLS